MTTTAEKRDPLMPEKDRGEERRLLRQAFVDDLYRIMADKKVSHRQMSLDLNLSSHSIVNRWRHLMAEPEPDTVFAIEEYLGVPPGGLSHHLGYLPPPESERWTPSTPTGPRGTGCDRTLRR